MKHVNAPLIVIVVFVAGVVLTCDGEAPEAVKTWAEAVVGPEGGTVEVTDPESSLYGLRIEVPEGALGVETNLKIQEQLTPMEGMELPGGLASFNPVVTLVPDVEFSKKITISFPTQGVPGDIDNIPSGFYYSALDGEWRVLMADAVSKNGFSVSTDRFGHWRWGFTLVHEVETQALEFTLEDLHGADTWRDMKQAAEDQFNESIIDLQDEETWENCHELEAVVNVLQGVMELSAEDLASKLEAACGGCDVTPGEFMDGLAEYIRERVRYFLVDEMVSACGLPFLLELYIRLEVAIHYQNVIENMECDYECLLEESPEGFWADIASYYIAGIALLIIDIGSDYQPCY
jgi:hypothetical protein